MTMSPLFLSVILVLLDTYPIVHCCNYTADTEGGAIELILNCSANYSTVTTVLRQLESRLQYYTVLFVCTQDSQGPNILIDGGIRGMTLNLTSMNISCGSLCTFGGCYISGGLGNFQRKLIPPQSCYICNEDGGGICMPENKNRTCNGNAHCLPSLDLETGSLNCNCSFEEVEDCSNTTISATTAKPDECICNCTKNYEGYTCKCTNRFECTSISECTLNICNAGCDSIEDTHQCFCYDRSGQNCTSIKRDTPTNIVVISIVVASLLLSSCLIVSCLLLYSTVSVNAKREKIRPMIVDPTVLNINEITCDPIDVATPKYQYFVLRSESYSTLLHSIDTLSTSLTTEQSRNELSPSSTLSKSSDTVDSSDAEGYIMCPCSRSSSGEVCHYCQANRKK